MSEQPQTTQARAVPQLSFYERVGGHETFVRLVHEFYLGVAEDEPLRELYPEEDLGPAEVRLRMFLEQYFGGPGTYSEQRGHPRLRMRHVPYEVTPTQRDRWLHHMFAAIGSISDQMAPQDEEFMRTYMLNAAHSLVNALEP